MGHKTIYITLLYTLIITASVLAQNKKTSNPAGSKQNKSNTNPNTTVQQAPKVLPINPIPPTQNLRSDNSGPSKQYSELQLKAKDDQDRRAYESYQKQKLQEKEAQERDYDQRMRADQEYAKKRMLEKEMAERNRQELNNKFKADSLKK